MTVGQKFVYWLDRHTTIFKKIETSRADWFEKTFPLEEWLEKDFKIIDIGAGVCDVTKKLQKYSKYPVVGIDNVDYRRIGNKKLNTFFYCISDATQLPFKNDSFDCVTIFWTLHHIATPFTALHEICRILKTGGQLIILEDLIDDGKKFKNFFTRIYDKLMNLEFSGHPHSNMSLAKWDKLIRQRFNFIPLQLKEIDWFTRMNLLKFGLLRYRKIYNC